MAVYVTSDLHGQYRRFLRLLDEIGFSERDRMYVLGDVIDRGPDSARLLIDLLHRPNVEILLGNHEYMMLDSLRSDQSLSRWIRNGADSTIDQFLELGVALEDLMFMWKHCPVVQWVTVRHTDYCLVHACPPRPEKKTLFAVDLTPEESREALWSRRLTKAADPAFARSLIKQWGSHTKILIGHTPVYQCPYARHDRQGLPEISWFGRRVCNLDCGAGRGLRIGVMNLSDGTCYYG